MWAKMWYILLVPLLEWLGLKLDPSVDTFDGALVGLLDRLDDGLIEGFCEGALNGAFDGAVDRSAVGGLVGILLGTVLGAVDGESDGTADGTAVGAFVGAKVKFSKCKSIIVNPKWCSSLCVGINMTKINLLCTGTWNICSWITRYHH